jgi:hypothetical protein
MRTLTLLVLMFAALLGAAHAQLPFPFEPEPDFSKRMQCARDHVRSVEQQAAALAKLRDAGPEAVGRLCALAEMGSAWLNGKLTDDTRKELRSLLDLDRIAAQCRTGQDALARELTAKLAQLRAELLRCDDTI